MRVIPFQVRFSTLTIRRLLEEEESNWSIFWAGFPIAVSDIESIMKIDYVQYNVFVFILDDGSMGFRHSMLLFTILSSLRKASPTNMTKDAGYLEVGAHRKQPLSRGCSGTFQDQNGRNALRLAYCLPSNTGFCLPILFHRIMKRVS